jgi:hypothetical protein
MSNAEAPISITSKTPAGSLVTIRANTGEELDQLVALSLASISSAVTELEGATRGGAPAPVAQANLAYAAQAFGTAPVQDVPPFNPAPSLGGGRTCPHGKMTALQGPSKNGGIYKGYFCPSAQGDPTKCKTIYVQKHEPDWNTFVPDKIK